LGTPDRFVRIWDDSRALLRVDLYASNDEAYAFEDAIVWHERVFLGFGHRVYAIDPRKALASEVFLAAYFCQFYPGEDYLLVASGDSLFRLAPDGEIRWVAADLGIDGLVVTSVENGLIRGEGEWDPPGGWKPFLLKIDSGKPPGHGLPESSSPLRAV
jgi:hypothetical protein